MSRCAINSHEIKARYQTQLNHNRDLDLDLQFTVLANCQFHPYTTEIAKVVRVEHGVGGGGGVIWYRQAYFHALGTFFLGECVCMLFVPSYNMLFIRLAERGRVA